jgi:hypothetical protein
MLALVHSQLLLFPNAQEHNWHPSPKGQGLRDKRTARQWIDSVVAYCEWRAGEPWRRLSDPEQRWDRERWNYLDASRLVREAYFESERPKGLYVPLPVLNAAPPPLPSELKLAKLSRSALISALIEENPQYTDARRLKFTRRKLARMLAETRLAAAAPVRRRA